MRVVGDERDLVIQAEGAHVHVGRANRAQAAVDDHILGVQHGRLAVQVDAHARLEERPVVGALCVADQELVKLLGKKELDLDAGESGVRQRGHEGFIGDEVRARDGHVHACR